MVPISDAEWTVMTLGLAAVPPEHHTTVRLLLHRAYVIGATGECRRQTDRLRAETAAIEATMAQWRKEAPYGG